MWGDIKMPYQIYLAHHGIKGQKWDVKHGPPYPLRSSVSTGKTLKKKVASAVAAHKEKKAQKKAEAKAAAERKKEAERQKVLASGDASDILKRRGEFSNEELAKAIDRLGKEEILKQYQKKEPSIVRDMMARHKEKQAQRAAQAQARDEKARAEAERQKEDERQSFLKTANATEILKRKNDYTPDELQTAINRIQKEQQLEKLTENEHMAAKKTMETINSQVSDINKYLTTATNLYNNFSTIQKIYDDKKSEGIKAEKARLLTSENAEELYKRRKELDADELKTLLKRFEQVDTLEEIAKRQKAARPAASS